ncbi:MAG: patatin-like phospholipase family protein [Gammaproteobacteria bacterium]|nr:patatin-like phospholipase family protein [Gammaproteobacteria bacterium]
MNTTTAPAANNLGLVLPGGGARAAYQVGVLKAVAQLLPRHAPNPFPIITGTSAGSINAVALAIHADNFRKGVLRIGRVWENFHVDQVFISDAGGLLKTGAHWLAALMLGGLGRYNPYALLDRKPLRPLLERYLPCDKIQQSIDAGLIKALGITASGYDSGQSVTFFQGHPGLTSWNRERRLGCAENITVDHLMASSAIPFIFAAIRLNREFFGDGSMRQIAPLSPAVHLGADRLLVVGIRKREEIPFSREQVRGYPTVAQVASHVLSSIFLDSLYTDLERLERINKTIRLIPEERRQQDGVTLRPIDVLTISPSQSIDEIALKHLHLLPRGMRFILKGVGASQKHGATLISYLLFEKEFCRELIALGYQDTLQVKEQLLAFLDTSKPYESI